MKKAPRLPHPRALLPKIVLQSPLTNQETAFPKLSKYITNRQLTNALIDDGRWSQQHLTDCLEVLEILDYSGDSSITLLAYSQKKG